MRLNKLDKEVIVRRILSDVPQIEYAEQAQKIIEEDMLRVASPKLADCLRDKDIRPLLLTGQYYYSVGNIHSRTSWGAMVTVYPGYLPSKQAEKDLAPVIQAATAQKRAKGDLKIKISAAIGGCSTRLQVLSRFPEFEKYLPPEPPKVDRSVPAISGLVADLSKAGWPK